MRKGYGRVSSTGQALYGTSLEEQRTKLLAAGVAEEDIYLDTYTGTKIHRPEFDRLVASLQPGDELVVCKLDRFARTAAEGATLVRELVDRGIRVNILNMGVADNTPIGRLMVTVLLAFAEYERDMIVERTQAGKAARRDSDPEYREGRKAADIDEALLRSVVAQHSAGAITAKQAAATLGVGVTTYYKYRGAISA